MLVFKLMESPSRQSWMKLVLGAAEEELAAVFPNPEPLTPVFKPLWGADID
jgi:hypothetical protein